MWSGGQQEVLYDHRLQQAEAHHEVQWDGWPQVVPIQPQVAEMWHLLQVVIREVMEGEDIMGADLSSVDLYGREGVKVSRWGKELRQR